jgi:hypothetical protein
MPGSGILAVARSSARRKLGPPTRLGDSRAASRAADPRHTRGTPGGDGRRPAPWRSPPWEPSADGRLNVGATGNTRAPAHPGAGARDVWHPDSGPGLPLGKRRKRGVEAHSPPGPPSAGSGRDQATGPSRTHAAPAGTNAAAGLEAPGERALVHPEPGRTHIWHPEPGSTAPQGCRPIGCHAPDLLPGAPAFRPSSTVEDGRSCVRPTTGTPPPPPETGHAAPHPTPPESTPANPRTGRGVPAAHDPGQSRVSAGRREGEGSA